MEEARQLQATIGRASAEHPSRKKLTVEEESMYKEILLTLDLAWSKVEKTSEEVEFLSKHEYRLG